MDFHTRLGPPCPLGDGLHGPAGAEHPPRARDILWPLPAAEWGAATRRLGMWPRGTTDRGRQDGPVPLACLPPSLGPWHGLHGGQRPYSTRSTAAGAACSAVSGRNA